MNLFEERLTGYFCSIAFRIPSFLISIVRQILNNDANNIVLLFGTDINECLLDACGGNSICNNTKGSFRCKCKAGFQSTSGDGKDCSGETVEMRGAVF